MCAIIDRNAAIVVFGRNPPEASVEFINWINEGKVKLVVGGKLLDELETTGAREWVHQGINSGLIITENDETVRDMTDKLCKNWPYKSDDQHIIALAQISGARLLYSHDGDLQKDFGNKKLIDRPRGKVYSTKKIKSFTSAHKRLLGRQDLCQK